MPAPLFAPRRAALAAGTLLLALAACGSDEAAPPEPQDPLQPYRTQVLQWHSCDPTLFDESIQDLAEALDDRLQCTSLRAPIDYDHPDRGDLSVAVLRVAAGHTDTRRQSLLFNPGGPGGDGLTYPLGLVDLWLDSTDATETGRLQQQLLHTYDLIGFSPRGLGSSTQLLCASGEQLLPTDDGASGRHPENIQRQLRNTERIAEACRKNPLTPYINTETTARDMDLIRELLGDARLNYIGWSYGTWLGAWYGSRFPDKVGRMVLDSSVDVTSTLPGAYLLQPPALTRAFNEVLAPYAARHPDVFELGDDAQAIRALPSRLHPAVQPALSSLLYRPLFSSDGAEITFKLLRVGVALSGEPFVASLPEGVEGGDFPRLHQLVEEYVFATDPETNEHLRHGAHQVLEKMQAATLPRQLNLAGEAAVYTAVVCNDTPPPSTDTQWWVDQETWVHRDYPLVSTDDFRSCLYWSRPDAVRQPPIAAMQGLDVLMVQAQYDGGTSAEGARQTFSLLPAAHMVYVPDEMTHALYPYGDECVDLSVARFLLHQAPTQRESVCPAKALPEDQLAAGLPRTALGPQGTYADPAGARARIAQLRSQIGLHPQAAP